ncbi:AsmA-like C-terminal region-containing protein [Aquamicrobium sp. LC103]|uniref:AsmA family protein n=1 Tax=Aquamicrobium sp. LC103 TaxID=1120658 RepID=UPI000B1C4E9E|nr:AsmA-like C-terminal region-containing protein [Aquamicrobium sp. LC103]
MVRTGIAALAALIVAAMLLIGVLPWLASTQIVRDRIAYELSLWSGYRVSLGEAPVLHVWPTFSATLTDVALHEWASTDAPPVIEADRVDVELSALAALRGNVVFSSLSISQPLLRLTRPGSVIDLPASPGGGRMMHAVETARAVIANNPGSPDLGALPSNAFGTVEFKEGRIVLDRGRGGEQNLVTGLAGRISWPALNRQATLSASGIWRGESISVEGSSQQPLVLLAGGNAPARVALKSAPLNASFEGVANLSENSFFDGAMSLSSPSLRRALEWSQTNIAAGAAIGSITATSKMTGNAKLLKFDTLEIDLGGNVGKGVLNAAFADVPGINGTLAFDKLDLGSFLAAFTPLATGRADIHDEIDTAFAEQLNLDVRLSAANATLGRITMSEVAATAQIKAGLTVFDISDATAFGGTLQTGMRIDRVEEGKAVEMRLLAEEVDAAAFAKIFGDTRLSPQGKANVSLMLKGTGTDWNTVLGNSQGSVTATLGAGTVNGFNLAAFTERLKEGDFFSLAEVTDGSLAVRGFDLKATVTSGVARVEKANLLLENRIIAVEGIAPYFGRALALSGDIAPVNADGAQGEPEASFFIGGAWDAPFVSPMRRLGDLDPANE